MLLKPTAAFLESLPTGLTSLGRQRSVAPNFTKFAEYEPQLLVFNLLHGR